MQAQAALDARRIMLCCPVCVQAAHSGNVSASICLAQVDDARGDLRSALKYWAKAAKLGHPEAQFRLGRVRSATVTGCFSCASVCLHKGFSATYVALVKSANTCIQDLQWHQQGMFRWGIYRVHSADDCLGSLCSDQPERSCERGHR